MIWRRTLDGLARRDRDHMGIVVLDWPEIREICCRLYSQITDGRSIGHQAYADAVAVGIDRHRCELRSSDWYRLNAFMEGLTSVLAGAPYRVHSGSGSWELRDSTPLVCWAQGKTRLIQERIAPIPEHELAKLLYPRILPERLHRNLMLVLGGEEGCA